MREYAHQILSQAIDAVVIIDDKNCVTFFNKSAEDLWGHPAEKVIGQNVRILVPRDLQQDHDTYVETNRETGEDKIVGTNRDVQLERADGSVIWANLSMSKIVEGGSITYAAFVKDVDEQYQNRARIEELLQQTSSKARQLAVVAEEANDAVVITNAEGQIVWCNNAFTEVSGYTFEEVAGRKPGSVLQGPETDPKTVQMIREILERKERMRTEILNYHKNGTPYWIEISLNPVFDEAGHISQFVAIERDITRAKQREVELEKAQAAAETANKAKSNFLANMSHEIRTPMNGIIGMAELLNETELTDEQYLCSRTIIDSSNALLRIINDILDFSKIEADKIVLRNEPFSLTNLVHDVVSLLQPKAIEKSIEVCVDLPDETPDMFVGDDGRMRQILLNLLGNAVKFTLQGYVEIKILYDGKGDDKLLTIAVTDTGIGVPPEKIDNVFSAFEQVDDEASRQFEGTGLGLAITSKLVSLMDGEIGVESTPGRGSTFTCRLGLPIAPSTGKSSEVTETAADKSILDGKVVYFVDDLLVNRKILERRLSGWGMKVRTVSSGTEFLDLMDNGLKCDVAIFDYNMPEMTGEALFRTFTERHADAGFPVVLYSSSDQAAEASELRQLGFAEILLKPAPSPVLAKVLIDVLTPAHFVISKQKQRRVDMSADRGSFLTGVEVLIAEDNRTNQLVLRKMLTPTGAELRFAVNGKEAVDFYATNGADLVLMDMSMPVMGGIEATERIRTLEGDGGLPACPIVALTANAMPADRDACMEAGMDDFLSKPVRKAELFAMIDGYIGMHDHQVLSAPVKRLRIPGSSRHSADTSGSDVDRID